MSDFNPNASSQPETRVQVVYGTYEEASDLFVNLTVAQIRHARQEAWGIPSNAKVRRGREDVNEDYVARRGDRIEFVRRQGDKG